MIKFPYLRLAYISTQNLCMKWFVIELKFSTFFTVTNSITRDIDNLIYSHAAALLI